MADVDDTLPEWSATAASNKPTGGTTVGTGWDDNLREIQKVVRGWLASKGSDLASAPTVDLGANEGLFHDITGTTTITSFGTVSAGIWKVLQFDGALTLTHNATSLILPGGANITTAAGDMLMCTSEGSGNWRVNWYVKAAGMASLTGTETLTNKSLTSPTLTGTPVAPTASADTNTTQVATTAFVLAQAVSQAEQEAGSSATKFVTPGYQQFHLSAAKGWCMADTGGVNAAGYNVASVTDTGTGRATINWANDFSSAAYVAVGCARAANASALFASIENSSFVAGATEVDTMVSTTGALADPNNFMIAVFGDQ